MGKYACRPAKIDESPHPRWGTIYGATVEVVEIKTERVVHTSYADSRDGREAVKQASTEAREWIREREELDRIRAQYEKSICHQLNEAKPVPFQKVIFADNSEPQANSCHENVDRWVKENPGTSVVRGWVDYMASVNGQMLTAHSVVRTSDGNLLDITPLADERVRPAMRFVPHVGDENLFSSLRQSSIFIDCPTV